MGLPEYMGLLECYYAMGLPESLIPAVKIPLWGLFVAPTPESDLGIPFS